MRIPIRLSLAFGSALCAVRMRVDISCTLDGVDWTRVQCAGLVSRPSRTTKPRASEFVRSDTHRTRFERLDTSGMRLDGFTRNSAIPPARGGYPESDMSPMPVNKGNGFMTDGVSWLSGQDSPRQSSTSVTGRHR